MILMGVLIIVLLALNFFIICFKYVMENGWPDIDPFLGCGYGYNDPTAGLRAQIHNDNLSTWARMDLQNQMLWDNKFDQSSRPSAFEELGSSVADCAGEIGNLLGSMTK